MNQEAVWLLKDLVLPPGGIVLLGLLGLILSRRFIGKLLIVLSLGTLYMLSTPFFAGTLISGLETTPPITPAAARNSGAGAILVLGGGRYTNAPEYPGDTVSARLLVRLRYAAWLSRRSGLPVIPSGGSPRTPGASEAALAKEVLEQEFGVKVLAIEGNSRTTWENAHLSKAVLARHGIQRILLVTHAFHMPRALAAFKQAGIDAIPAPTAYRHTPGEQRKLTDWLPSASSLQLSYYALHEYLGRLWYQMRELA